MARTRVSRTAGIVVAMALAAASVVTATGQTASAATGDIGFADQSYSGVSNPPTSDKPQSKLWYNDGLWWANMWGSTTGWHIYRLDRSANSWVDTGTAVDSRAQTLSDALWDGSKLYIGSQYVTISDDTTTRTSVAQPARLYRYSYDSVNKKYVLDAGFPSNINNSSSESLTIDKDTTGVLWATWTQVSGSSTAGYTSKVYVNSSVNGGTSWGTPAVVPAAGTNTSIAPDDISAVVSYGKNTAGKGKIGVMWSNHKDDTVYWATHDDGAAIGTWKGSVAVKGSKQPDDHLNLKTIQSDNAGRVFAAVKTSLDQLAGHASTDPQINLLQFKPNTGSWSTTRFGTIADCHTRPIVVLDEENQEAHVFATAPTASGCSSSGAPGTIYEKSAPLANPVFASGRGTPVIRDIASANMNNVTSTKQSLTSASGLVVLASNNTTKRYWHADLKLRTSAPVAPTASFTASPTSGTAPLAVQFTDTSTGSPTSWAWDFGDGTSSAPSTSTAQSPSHTYAAAGTYTATLVATNATGSSTAASRTITVSAAPTPTAPTASFTASATSGTAPLTVNFTDTSTGSPTAWAWNFGDSSTTATSAVQNPSHTFTAAGTYTVTLTASNAAGSSTTAATKTITVTAAPPPPAGGSIARAATATKELTTAGTVIAVDKPVGTAAGDLLVSCIATNGTTVTTPSGWTRLAASTGINNPKVYGYYRVAGSAEPASYSWTIGSSVASGGIARYTGASSVGTASTASGLASVPVTVPGVTTTAANSMVVGCVGLNSGSSSVVIGSPTGMSQAWDLGTKRQELDDAVQASAGATGSRTWPITGTRDWAGWLVALNPS